MTILYIDDDPDDMEIFHEALREVDPTCVFYEAGNGIEGFKKLDELTPLPDFIFVDINMPEMNGKEFLKEIKETPGLKTIPIVIYSTTANAEDARHYFGLGAFKVILKPNTFNRACELIGSVIKSG